CGIAGVLKLDGEPASAALARSMADAMPHRGPDGRGAWSDGPVAFAHARLVVRDRSDAGAQPAVAPGGEGVLVYNGEVYNDDELRPPFEGVENVGPGERWTFQGRRATRVSWCDLAASIDLSRLKAAGREPAADREARIAETMARAVREHLASDVPIAAFTSGG